MDPHSVRDVADAVHFEQIGYELFRHKCYEKFDLILLEEKLSSRPLAERNQR